MSHNFLSSGSMPGSDSLIMIALNPELEVSSSRNHFIVGLLVVIELFEIGDVGTNFTEGY